MGPLRHWAGIIVPFSSSWSWTRKRPWLAAKVPRSCCSEIQTFQTFVLFVILLRMGHTWSLFGSCPLFLLQISFLIEEPTSSLPTAFSIWPTMLSCFPLKQLVCVLWQVLLLELKVLHRTSWRSLFFHHLCQIVLVDDIQLLSSCETFFSPAETLLSSLSLSASRYVRLLPSLEQPDITFFRPTKYFFFLFPPQTASTDEFFCQKLQLRFDLRGISPRQGLLIQVRKYTFRLSFYKFWYNLIIFSEENTSRRGGLRVLWYFRLDCWLPFQIDGWVLLTGLGRGTRHCIPSHQILHLLGVIPSWNHVHVSLIVFDVLNQRLSKNNNTIGRI